MAQNKTFTVTFVDDLSGKPVEEDSVETFPFAFEGTNYEIDLGETNANAFRKAMAKYTAAARVVTGRQTGSKREDLAQVREWAANNGFSVRDRGRVPVAVLTAYDNFHNGGDNS